MLSTELQLATAVNNPARTGLPGGPRRINQNFDIEGLEPSISVYDLTFDIEDSSISNTPDIEEKASISKNLRYRVLDIEVPTFDIEVSSLLCASESISKYADFDIEVLVVQTFIFDIEVTTSYPISKLNH